MPAAPISHASTLPNPAVAAAPGNSDGALADGGAAVVEFARVVVVRDRLGTGAEYDVVINEIAGVLLSSVLEMTGTSEEDSDTALSEGVGASDVESAVLLEGSALEGEDEEEEAGVSLLDSGVLEGTGVSLLEGEGDSLLDGDGDSLLEDSRIELGGLPELLEADGETVVASAVDTIVVGERVTVGLCTDVNVC